VVKGRSQAGNQEKKRGGEKKKQRRRDTVLYMEKGREREREGRGERDYTKTE